MRPWYSISFPVAAAALLVGAFVLFSTPFMPLQAKPAPVVVEAPLNLRDTVHVITVLANDGSIMGHGSGVMVAPQLMLTAAHVAGDGSSRLRVGLEQAFAKVLKFDTGADIALLQVPLGCPCAALADASPAVDAEATAIGYPSFPSLGTQILTIGRIQGVVALDKRVLFSAPISNGNSGGGLFYSGKLVGIVVEVAGGGSVFGSYPIFHLARAVDTVTMRDFYTSYKPVRVDPKLNEYTGGRLTAVKTIPQFAFRE